MDSRGRGLPVGQPKLGAYRKKSTICSQDAVFGAYMEGAVVSSYGGGRVSLLTR
jgi:hypothetical protein